MSLIFTKLKKKWQLIVYVSLILGAITFLVSTLITPKYRSDASILIVQRGTSTFSAARSSEYLSDVFSQVLYTDSFLDDVLSSPFNIEKEFSSDPKKRKKQWKKEVDVDKVADAGILKVRVFDPSRQQAERIASGIAWNFVVNGAQYHGDAENIEVKVIDGPIIGRKPAHPNVFLNALLGLLIGFFGSVIVVLFFDEFDLKMVERKTSTKLLVERELQRQLERRKQKEDLDDQYESEVYKIEKVVGGGVEKSSTKNEREKEDGGKPVSRKAETNKTEEKVSVVAVEKSNVIDPEKPGHVEIEAKQTPDQVQERKKQEELSSEIEQKRKEVVKQESQIVEKEDLKLGENKESEEKILQKEQQEEAKIEGIEGEEREKRGIFSKLYDKSLFADKFFANRKRIIAKQEKAKQEKLDKPESEIVESVKKVEMDVSETKEAPKTQLPLTGGDRRKAPAPDDLPIFASANESQKLDNRKPNEKENGAEQKGAEGSGKEDSGEGFVDPDGEPTDDEVKERLNKLLKGEL